MASLNKVLLIGRLGKDPEGKALQSGGYICNLTVATSDNWKDKNGDKQERTEWHKIDVWGNRGKSCAKYLSKGRQVHIEGSLKTDAWEKEGKKMFTTKIVALNVIFLGDKDGDSGGNSYPKDKVSNFVNSKEPYDHGDGSEFQDKESDKDLPF